VSARESPVQVGLVEAGPLREDFRRFLQFAAELAPDVALREEPFCIVLERAGEVLARCRPAARIVRVALGPEAGGEVGCQRHEHFVDILARLLEGERQRLRLPPAAG